MISFTSAVEPLRIANRGSGKELYRWCVYTVDGLPEKAGNGIEITPNTGVGRLVSTGC